MNPITVISAISAIFSFLSIVFDVPNKQKISVSLKTFVLMLSVISFLFIWIFSPYFKNPSLKKVTTDDSSQSKDSSTNQPVNEPTSVSTDEPTNTSTDEPTSASTDARILQIDPIVPYLCEVNPIISQSLEIPAIDIGKIFGEIYETD